VQLGDRRKVDVVNRRYVDSLPDLIAPEEYAEHPDGRLLRFRIGVGPDGVEIIGDGFRPVELERAMKAIAGTSIEQMLCG